MASNDQLTDRQQREVQDFLQKQQQVALVQQAISKLTDICWDKCLDKHPGSSLSNRESTCLTQCAQRYLDTSAFVMNQLVQKNA
ncbi:Mitochondrial import inner membrane translocase subunit [Plasmodiophora brassicae]|uniref:Mitochondrial import inner membrane translocase subunit n=1 Tax=Plasmodiophora brassicae TaxID=37360 RepID=A0A0G4IWM3_PLABS|nr:hypothetical protein PBRA_007451 [Plasmodiophora brassicae]